MSPYPSRSALVAYRGELMAELFLQDFRPQFLSRPTSPGVGYDLLVGFVNKKGGINTFAVEVKATERPPGKRFPLPRRVFDHFAGSNIPGLLLVVDAKENRLYFGWLSSGHATGSAMVSIPLTEVNNTTKKQLQKQLEAANGDAQVVR